MNDVLNWIQDSLISIFLPAICIILGIFLIFFGGTLSSMLNQNIGNTLLLIGIILFLGGFALPIYFFIKSIFISIKDVSSKDSTYKISGLIGIIILVISILSYRDYIFNMSQNTLTALIIFFIISFTFLIFLLLIIKIIHLIILRLIRFVTDLKNKK